MAAYLGHATIVRMLIDAGASMKHKDNDGNALDNARRQDKQQVREVLPPPLSYPARDE